METRSERLKTLFPVSTVTPLPRRPGIRLEDQHMPDVAPYIAKQSLQPRI